MKSTSVDALKKIPVLSRLTEDDLKIMSRRMEFQTVDSGKMLLNEGEKGDFICFVANGRLEVVKKTYTDHEIVINTLSRGQSFGEMSLIESLPRSASVKAIIQTDIIKLTRADFDLIMEQHTEIGIKILKGISLLLSKKLRHTTSRLIDYMSTGA